MSESIENILKRLGALEQEVERLKSAGNSNEFTVEKIAYFEALPANSTVGKDYISFRFGCSLRAVTRKEAGTRRIKLVSRKPIKAIKRDVDAAFREHTKPASAKAAEARAKARTVKRRRRSNL